MKNILITGGAGFIGTNLTLALVNLGMNVVVVDDFKNSYKHNIDMIAKKYADQVSVYRQDVTNKTALKQILLKHNIHAIMHLAAKKYIDESIKKPALYYHNNMTALEVVLDLALECNIKDIMFASTMAVYGNPKSLPIKETEEYNPISPYADTKRLGELAIIDWINHNPDKNAIIYRFSNPIGADDKLMLGDNAKRKNNSLLPYIINNALQDNSLTLNGNNHDTRDGTPIRDYIHVKDIAQIVAKTFTQNNNKGCNIYNVGCGADGYTVLEMIKSVSNKLNKPINYTFGPKRAGDIEKLVCDNTKLMQTFDVELKYSLDEMVSSHVNFVKYLNQKSKDKNKR